MNTKSEQLIDAVRCVLEVSLEPLSEYAFLQLLSDQGWELPTTASDPLALYSSHFLLFNALYSLQDQYWLEHRYLEISALNIVLHKVITANTKSDTSTSLLYSNDKSLRDYYLDLSQLESATNESVNQLLSQFWGKYLAIDEREEALGIFGLPATTSYSEIKKAYRRLAMSSHPDRGGDVEAFQTVNRAFGILQRLYSDG